MESTLKAEISAGGWRRICGGPPNMAIYLLLT